MNNISVSGECQPSLLNLEMAEHLCCWWMAFLHSSPLNVFHVLTEWLSSHYSQNLNESILLKNLKCILFLGALCMSKLFFWQHQSSSGELQGRQASKWDDAKWSNFQQMLFQIAPVILLICSSHILTSRAAEAPGFTLVSCQPALINLFRNSWFSPSVLILCWVLI